MNRPSAERARHRGAVSICEAFEARVMLAGEPAPAPYFDRDVLRVTGTTGPDVIRMDIVPDEVLVVEVNGTRYELDWNRLEEFNFDTLGSDDPERPDRLELGPGPRGHPGVLNFGPLASNLPHVFSLTTDDERQGLGVSGDAVTVVNEPWTVTGYTRVEYHTGSADDSFSVSGSGGGNIVGVDVFSGGGNDTLQGSGMPVNFHGEAGDDQAAMYPFEGRTAINFDGGPGTDTVVHFESQGVVVGQQGAYDLEGNRVDVTGVENIGITPTDYNIPTRIIDGGAAFQEITFDTDDFEGPHRLEFAVAGDDAPNHVTVTPFEVTGMGPRLVLSRSVQYLALSTAGGDDTVDVSALADDPYGNFFRLGLNTGEGDDVVRLGNPESAAYWGTRFIVDAENGEDQLVVDERARAGDGANYALDAGSVTRSRGDDLGGAILFSGFETVTLEDGDKPSHVTATNSPDTVFRVRGNGNGPGADVLSVVNASGAVVHDPGATGAGVFVTPGAKRIEYGGIERAEIVDAPNRVTGRHVFYNNSAFDGRNPAVNAGDLNAVAPDKRALLPGQFWSGENVTTYTKGINGVIVEFDEAPPATLTADDFVFEVGVADPPSVWDQPAPAPSAVTLLPVGTAPGPTRYAITWADGAIVNTELSVLVKANEHTGLAAPDVFYFANLVGESAQAPPPWWPALTVNVLDLTATRRAMTLRPVAITNRYDHNKDGRVNVLDLLAVRRAAVQQASLYNVPGPAWGLDEQSGGAAAGATALVRGIA